MTNQQPLIDATPDHLAVVRKILCRHLAQEQVWAFGSRATWTARDYSDLDLVIVGKGPLRDEVLGALKHDFNQSDLPWKVDIIDWAGLSTSFKKIIKKDKVDFPLDTGCDLVKLDHYCEINPETISKDYEHISIRYMDISSVGTGVFNEKPKTMQLSDAPSRAKRIVRKNDTIISTVRPNRRSFKFMKNAMPNDVASTGFAVLRAKENVNPRFVYYMVSDQKYTDYIVSHAEGSAYPAVGPDSIISAPVAFFDYKDQKAIADMLGALDDKMENNRRLCATLAALAKAIFKSWFVDFDPVRARMQGRRSGLPDPINNLFPDTLTDSEIGKIPKGWEVTVVSSFGNVICGKTPSTKDPENFDGGYPFITIPDMRGNIPILKTERTISDKGALLLKGKMLPAGSICVSCIATQGLVGITTTDSFTNQQINSIVPNVDEQKEYLTFSMMTFGQLISSAGSGGSVFANLSTGRFKELPILEPSRNIIGIFSKTIRPMLERIELAQKEIFILSELRDTLLPRLISGKLQIREAQNLLKKGGP